MKFRIFLIITLSVLCSVPAWAANWTVCAGGCDFDRISSAVSAAAAGDTLELAAETFTEYNINLDKDLTIVGAGAEATVVQAASHPSTSSPGRVFIVDSAATVLMQDLTLQNGYTQSNDSTGGNVRNEGDLTMERVRLLNGMVLLKESPIRIPQPM